MRGTMDLPVAELAATKGISRACDTLEIPVPAATER
jgi:hypothetical protein